MKAISPSAAVVMFLTALTGSARANTVTILATADAVVNNGTTLVTHPDGLPANATQRSMVEFNLSSIPHGSTITAATFEGLIIITTGSGSITVSFGVYAGDGIMTLADATASTTVDGTYIANLSNLGDPTALVSLNPTSVNNAFASTGFVGIDLYKTSGRSDAGIDLDGLDDNLNPSFLKPTLLVTYSVPEPTTLSLLCASLGALMSRRCFRRVSVG